MTEAVAAANTEDSGPIDPFKTNPAKEEVLHALCDRTGYQLIQVSPLYLLMFKRQ